MESTETLFSESGAYCWYADVQLFYFYVLSAAAGVSSLGNMKDFRMPINSSLDVFSSKEFKGNLKGF